MSDRVGNCDACGRFGDLTKRRVSFVRGKAAWDQYLCAKCIGILGAEKREENAKGTD